MKPLIVLHQISFLFIHFTKILQFFKFFINFREFFNIKCICPWWKRHLFARIVFQSDDTYIANVNHRLLKSYWEWHIYPQISVKTSKILFNRSISVRKRFLLKEWKCGKKKKMIAIYRFVLIKFVTQQRMFLRHIMKSDESNCVLVKDILIIEVGYTSIFIPLQPKWTDSDRTFSMMEVIRDKTSSTYEFFDFVILFLCWTKIFKWSKVISI